MLLKFDFFVVKLLYYDNHLHRISDCQGNNGDYIVVQHREIYRVTEGLNRERASLLKQLDLLRYGSVGTAELSPA